MGSFAVGSVVLVRFPFSDLSQAKLRPAVALADCGRGDWLLCQITSNRYADPRAIGLAAPDFQKGSLRISSYARPGKLFTAHESLIACEVGSLREGSLRRVREAVIQMLQTDL